MADSIAVTAGGCVFAGGGTGGHLFPAIAIARALRRRRDNAPVLFVGSDRPRERELLAGEGFEHVGLSVAPRRELLRRPWTFSYRLWQAYRAARRLLDERRPAVVIGCGGLASVPTVYAAHRSGVPIVLLEQNVLPGRATRRLSRWADVVCLSFEESRTWLPRGVPAVVTGNPVRAEIAALAQVTERAASGSDAEGRTESGGSPVPAAERQTFSADGPRRLLVLGGSLGSKSLNDAVLTAMAEDASRWRAWSITHQTGGDDCARVRGRYGELGLTARVEAFLPELPALLSMRPLVITRAGATTLAELACAGCATIAVPWRGAADDHQRLNAQWYADRGAVVVAADGDAQSPRAGTQPVLHETLLRLRDDPRLRSRLAAATKAVAHPRATDSVLSVVDATGSH